MDTTNTVLFHCPMCQKRFRVPASAADRPCCPQCRKKQRSRCATETNHRQRKPAANLLSQCTEIETADPQLCHFRLDNGVFELVESTDRARLTLLIQNGLLSAHTLVKLDASEKWVHANRVATIAELFSQIQPTHVSKGGKKSVAFDTVANTGKTRQFLLVSFIVAILSLTCVDLCIGGSGRPPLSVVFLAGLFLAVLFLGIQALPWFGLRCSVDSVPAVSLAWMALIGSFGLLFLLAAVLGDSPVASLSLALLLISQPVFAIIRYSSRGSESQLTYTWIATSTVAICVFTVDLSASPELRSVSDRNNNPHGMSTLDDASLPHSSNRQLEGPNHRTRHYSQKPTEPEIEFARRYVVEKFRRETKLSESEVQEAADAVIRYHLNRR